VTNITCISERAPAILSYFYKHCALEWCSNEKSKSLIKWYVWSKRNHKLGTTLCTKAV